MTERKKNKLLQSAYHTNEKYLEKATKVTYRYYLIPLIGFSNY